MGWWTERVVPRMNDVSLRHSDLVPYRVRACSGLHGLVAELGFGSGLNIEHYPKGVTRILAVEPSDLAWDLSAPRRAASRIPVARGGLDGQRLDLDDDSVDAVLSTFTLCTIPDPSRALAEVRRVLKPGGTFHFLEHGISPEASVARWQGILEPLNARLAGNCHLTRQIDRLVTDAGFRMDELDAGYLDINAPKHQRHGFLGTATKAGA
ncbi:class I SAM-dependent methyltransferase [Sinomonas sp. ASV322]|uniref:class I SAM-dependent methyltransferase n=1 Tax=Sinomonas sp. ASV322 TaxID=3041920 RepID=UPI0027DCA7AB|nr:class I SAM-dependent methyltransferase [Sinomonas sp. ASV322]MDQ4503608.1 class I SAM-dependent methyltransferase [Sinomonas sp. ASV322]